jgi:hypothetical protein
MRHKFRKALAVFAIGSTILSALTAHAARPLVTEDAAIADTGTCELELWLERPRDATELWIMPACNFIGNWEFTLGGSVERADGSTGSGEFEFMAKTIFREMSTEQLGIGLAAGVIRDSNATRNQEEFFAIVPVSRTFMDERLLTHANLGWLRQRETRDHMLTWALATEYELTNRTRVVGEVFGEDDETPHFQLGVAHWLVPDRVQVDFTWGDQLDRHSEERFFTVGVVLVSEPFLR